MKKKTSFNTNDTSSFCITFCTNRDVCVWCEQPLETVTATMKDILSLYLKRQSRSRELHFSFFCVTPPRAKKEGRPDNLVAVFKIKYQFQYHFFKETGLLRIVTFQTSCAVINVHARLVFKTEVWGRVGHLKVAFVLLKEGPKERLRRRRVANMFHLHPVEAVNSEMAL